MSEPLTTRERIRAVIEAWIDGAGPYVRDGALDDLAERARARMSEGGLP